MSDAPSPHRTDPALEDHRHAEPLTPERIDAILADFRAWLASWGEEPDEEDGDDGTVPVDLGTLVEQFTALRHEVHLQTRAARQATEALKAVDPASDPTEPLRPAVAVLIDVADALLVSLHQVERARETAQTLLEGLTARAAEPRGFLGRLLGRPPVETPDLAAADRLERLEAGVADGYAVGVEVVPARGLPFDPEWMEVLEVVNVPDQPSGTVVEEVRHGYVWNGKPLRNALVKVAR
jgi:molecular chaperone GrpE